MTDHDLLLQAIIADPDDDTARLVYADFIQEAGEEERAEFVRTQIELDRTPEWEPFAVRCRRADLATQAGDRWRSTLPWADGWNPRFPFRRGLGHSIKMTALRHLLEYGEQLFASAPLGELHLPGGEMTEYWDFARQPWLPRVRSVRFCSHETPTEPVRALCASPLSTGLLAVHFERAISPGMSFLVEALFQSPLGQQLRELSFRVGDGSQLDLIEAFEAGGPANLEQLTFDNMGLDAPATTRLTRSPVFKTLRTLTFKDMFFKARQVEQILGSSSKKLESLTLHNMGFVASEHESLESLSSKKFANLRRLDFTKSYGFRWQLASILVKSLAGLRSLRLAEMNLEDAFIGQLVQAPFWANLVELDLSENQLADQAGRYLLAVTPPPELTTLDLRDNTTLSPRMREQLREHYRASVLLPDAT